MLRVDGPLYVLLAACCTLASARMFYGYMLRQTGGEWSAPLDDVFIHFDYARATAQGYPFQWSVGNGYSSGNTSLTYPFVLAIGWIAGFREQALMKWAAIVAMVSVFGMLLAVRPMFLRITERRAERGAMRALSFLLPPIMLGVGVLAWSFWSGMEVAFFLGIWACALLAFFALEDAGPKERRRRAFFLGLWGVLLVATRPEATTTIAAFGLVAVFGRRSLRFGERARLLLLVGAPAAALLAIQAFANKQLTGESSANGAIVKLAINNPFFTTQDKLSDYTFNLQWTALRNLAYHFTDRPYFGFIFPALGAFALAVPATRRYAALLWLQIFGWIALVALNGQVRWQNDRYTMPAVAWLLILGALGAAALLRRSGRPGLVATLVSGTVLVELIVLAMRRAGMTPEQQLPWSFIVGGVLLVYGALHFWPARVLAVSVGLYLAHDHQIAKMRDQKWFFGRASRNILDQHVTTGRKLAALRPKRVLIGDAGAIMYASERPGLDIIGLGGYHDYPFGRASVQGLAAVIELIERMPESERPDVMAIYPSWWGVLPTWFADRELFRTPAEGNVICGGYEDVVYSTDWHVLGTGDAPRALVTGRVVDALDVADLVSEKEHDYVFDRPGNGWTDMKILEDPADRLLVMFDGGRRIGAGRGERFRLGNLRPGVPAQLIVRSAPDAKSHVRVLIGGHLAGALDLTPTNGWVEHVLELPGDLVHGALDVRIENDGGGDFVDYHVWIAQ